MKRYMLLASLLVCSNYSIAQSNSLERLKLQGGESGMRNNVDAAANTDQPQIKLSNKENIARNSNLKPLHIVRGGWEPIGSSTIGNASSNPKWHVTWWVGIDGDQFAVMACHVNSATIARGPVCSTYKHPTKIAEYTMMGWNDTASHGLESAYVTLLFYKDPSFPGQEISACIFNPVAGIRCSPRKVLP